MYTFWKIILVLTLNSGAVDQELKFDTPAQCEAAFEYLEAHGLEAGECHPISVWSNVGPDGYDAIKGEFVQ